MKHFIRTTAAALVVTVGCIAMTTTAGAATAATAQSGGVRVSVSVDCSQSQSIQTTAQFSHSSSQDRYIYTRAYYYKWTNGSWKHTASVDRQGWATGKGAIFGMPASVTAAATANGPAYFYVGVDSWVWGGTQWTYIGRAWVNNYIVRAPNGRTSTSNFCEVVNAARMPF